MGSRWRIHSHEEIDFSIQYLVNCAKDGGPDDNRSKGCFGGSSYGAFHYTSTNGAVDSSCLPYTAENHQCDALNICQQHWNMSSPIVPATPIRHFVSEFGHIQGEEEMQKEVYARGPISCCMSTNDEFNTYQGGVFSTSDNSTFCHHLVTVVGFGGANDEAYWVVQNSFGTVWGEKGIMKLKRSSALKAGEYNLGIEKFCSWMMPGTSRQPSEEQLVV